MVDKNDKVYFLSLGDFLFNIYHEKRIAIVAVRKLGSVNWIIRMAGGQNSSWKTIMVGVIVEHTNGRNKRIQRTWIEIIYQRPWYSIDRSWKLNLIILKNSTIWQSQYFKSISYFFFQTYQKCLQIIMYSIQTLEDRDWELTQKRKWNLDYFSLLSSLCINLNEKFSRVHVHFETGLWSRTINSAWKARLVKI